MGYAHFWRRGAVLDRSGFEKAVDDLRVLFMRAAEMGIKLAGPRGEGKPELSFNTIAFNGRRDCGHRYRDLGKPYPAKEARGIEDGANPVAEGEPWFSGPFLNTRSCGGECAGGAFIVDREFMVRAWDRPNAAGYMCICETDFKPYDLVVTAALIRLKEHLGSEIVISSDGHETGFEDAKRLCRELFGWASNFELEAQESEVV